MSVSLSHLWSLRWHHLGLGFGLLLVLSAPLHGAIQVLDGLYQESSVTSGQTLQHGLSIHNPTHDPQTVILTQTDEQFGTGLEPFPVVGTNARSNAAWLHFPAMQWVVPPQSTITVPYEIVVPMDSNLSGAYWSVVMVQVAAADAALGGSAGFSIRQTFRTAVRVVSHVHTDPPARASLSFHESAFDRNDQGDIGLDLRLKNDGELSLQLQLFVEVIDAMGQRIERTVPERARLLPQNQVHRWVALPALTAGRYEVLAVAEHDDGQVFAARYVLNIALR